MQQEASNTQDMNFKTHPKQKILSQWQGGQQKEFINQQDPTQPIYRINHQFLDLKYFLNNPCYQTNPQLLTHTKIKPLDREKLKSWLLFQTQNMYQRETYALTSKYLDLFFSKRQKVPKNLFQMLGIACLILAAKVNQRRIPSISFQVFDRNQIFEFQISLLKIFNFKVNPITYVALAQDLLKSWDNFQNKSNPFNEVKYYTDGVNSIRRIRIIMETLDCIDLVHKSLVFPLDSLVMTVFYLQNRRFCLQKFKINKQKYAQNDFQKEFNDCYVKIMQQFMNHLLNTSPVFAQTKIYFKLLLFALRFSRINPKINCRPNYKNFRFETTKQTYNPEISQIARVYLNLINS